MDFKLEKIGVVRAGGDGFFIEVEPRFRNALEGLQDFGCAQILWWADGCDNDEARSKLVEEKPYKKGPQTLGVFATRSPERPNPIAVSAVFVSFVDVKKGIVRLEWIDADDGTPVLDIKPYVPSVDRVENPVAPNWCAHWPKSVETSGDFDWAAEFNF